LFANDLIYVVLGPKWGGAVPIFRLLAPTILALAILNPLGWLIFSSGMAARGLKMALVITPIMIVGFTLGLPFGPWAVACAYSLVMLLWIVPAIAWVVHGTNLSVREVLLTIGRPLAAGLVSGALAFSIGLACEQLSPLARLAIQTSVLSIAYAVLLFFA